MNLHDIILKQYQAGFAEVADAPVTRRHYIDDKPSGNSKTLIPFTEDSPRAVKMKRRVIAHLEKHPGATARDITKSLAMSMKQLQSYTCRLVDEGMLRYELTSPPKNGGRRKFMYYVTEAV